MFRIRIRIQGYVGDYDQCGVLSTDQATVVE